MKSIIVIICAFGLSLNSFAQPEGFNYQAVLRNANGEVLTNSPATMRFTFINFNVSAPLVYQEVHDLETNEFGLINTVIGPEPGNGFSIVGNWDNILWGDYEVFMKVEVDLLDGNGYTSLGINQVWSVPHALVSGKAVNMIMSDMLDVHYPSMPQEGQVLMYSAEEWENWVPTDLPSDSDNQTLSVFLEEISIAGGNSVNLNSWCRDGNTGIAANAFLGTEDGHDLVFKTNAEERMRLGQDGGFHIMESVNIDQNVGIGIAPSTVRLHLHSTVNPQPAMKLTNAITGSNLLDGFQIGLTTTGDVQILNWENSDMIFSNNIFERMRIKDNGNIGIGTSNPLGMLSLHTDSGIDTYMRFSNAPAGLTTNDGALLGLSATGDFNIINKENTDMNLYTNNLVRITVDQSGNVGIGDNTPDYKLDVAGTIGTSSVVASGAITAVSIDVSGHAESQDVQVMGLALSESNATRRVVLVNDEGFLVTEDGDEGYYYYAVHPFEFRPDDSDAGYHYESANFALETPYSYYFAPFHLPDGAVIVGADFYIDDPDPDTNVTVKIGQENYSFGGNGSDYSATSSGSSGLQTLYVDASAMSVNNSINSYYVMAYVFDEDDPIGIAIAGVRIKYRL